MGVVGQPGQSWPLPYTQSGELHDLALYARDVMVFSRKFLAFLGLLRQGPRMLPSSAAELSAVRSLEERTDALITNQSSAAGMGSSWRRAGSRRCSTTPLWPSCAIAGPIWCCSTPCCCATASLFRLRLQWLRKTQEVSGHRELLRVGVQQLCAALPGELPPYIQSTWVSAEGYCIIFNLEDMEVANQKFLTSIKVLGVAWLRPVTLRDTRL